METDQFLEEHAQKKGRHRTKQLYSSILQQMEFYFSDSNITKDRFLAKLIQTDPYVDLSIFLKFNKLRHLTTNVEHIVKAVSKSEVLELNEDKTKLRRKLPIKEKTNVDECTIYVERLKSDVTHDWLKSIFMEFGNVVYVSIPKYKHTGIIKGFAFVEFETEEGADLALKFFESIDCKISSHVKPEELCSIATFDGDTKKIMNMVEKDDKPKHSDLAQEAGELDLNEKKLLQGDLMENVEKVIEKKRKYSMDVPQEKVESLDLDNENPAPKRMKIDETVVNKKNTSEEENCSGEKRNKKMKKANKKKMAIKEIGLQILSKKDWKKMRNRYLDMQRNTMKQLKMHLNRQTHNRPNIKHDDRNKMETKEVNFEYIPGTIVKISLLVPCEENKKLRGEIMSFSSQVKYVDIAHPCGSQEVYVRFADSESADTFCKTNFKKGSLCLLSGEEERDYWKKIEANRQKKQKKSAVKQRGRDRLLKKAEKQAVTHIRFDE